MYGQPRSDIAVIGAGVTGLSIAYHLVSRGDATVTIYERRGIAAEASGVQPGGVRQQWGTKINCLMGRESLLFYRDVRERLDSRVDPVFRSCAYVFVAESSAVYSQLKRNVRLQNSLGIPSELLTPEQARDVVPDLGINSLVGAAYCREDGYFDRPQAVVQAFAEAAIREGAAIEYAGVVELIRQDPAWRLALANGTEAWANQIVIAAGSDSPALVGPLGVELPIDKELRAIFYSNPIQERLLDPLVVSPERRFAAKQLGDGRVLASDLSATSQPGEASETWMARIRKNMEELLPRLQFVSFPLLVEGFYDMTPDGQAVLGPIEGFEGLWIAAGFSGHGFMMAPVVGDRMATAILEGIQGVELELLSLSRFSRDALIPEPQVV